MKNIKLLFFSMLISLTVLTSCQNNDDIIDDMADVTESASLRSALSNLELIINEDGSLNDMENPTGNIIFDFCFDFVYPINLEYNNGTTVTVNNFEELILVLINSTEDLYIVGIEFPFEVEVFNEDTNEIEIISINNEEEFIALIESCGFDDSCECTDEYEPVCVEIITDNGTIIITFPNECLAECEGFTEEDFIDCVTDSCEDECPDQYEPVCVQTPNGGIEEYDNICLAFCDGYDQEDLVDCENDECEVGPIEVIVGDCNDNGTYVLTINFEHVNPGNEYFDLYVRNNELLGYYLLSDLPLTINNFELSGFDNDYIKVCINDNPNCCNETEWIPPACNGDGCEDECPQEEDPVCVEVNGTIITFLNACYAECAGYTDYIDCDNSSCEDECPDQYEPVCVQTPNGGIEEYDNICLAFCDGYDQEDLVDCENDECEVGPIEVIVGDCNDNGTYVLTINFEHVNPGNEYFDLYVRNNELLGYYLLSDLPLTINNFELSGLDNDYIKVCINDNPNCCNETEWIPPACNGDGCEDNCPQEEDPVCVEVDNTIITFLNACYAECAGYTDYYECD
jgi:hypothetical protein